ncbi:MAG: CRISPR-associated endonuclease Cas1, partial [Elusimicrobiota bacterium]
EAGLKVSSAAIYYAADRKRVPVELSDELLKKVETITKEARETASSGICPKPLENDRRCSFCSAYPVCLPNESRYWANPGSPAPKELEPPLADRDEGEVLVVQDARSYVGKHGDEVRVTRDKETLAKVPLHQLRAIYLYGPVQVSAQLMQLCLEETIDIAYFAASGRFLGLLRGLPASGIDARRGQYNLFSDSAIKLGLAKEIVRGKIHNQRVMLMRNGSAAENILAQLKGLREKASGAENEAQLLGIEGEAAALYFGQFSTMLKNAAFDFNGRNRRPPRDPVNALLSLGYSILAKELSGVCHTVGLDPFLGFYHHPRYGRPALALDLMEEFRPLVVDSLALSLLNRGELDAKSDFIFSSEGCALNEQGRRAFWQGWFRRLDTEVTHPVFGYQMSYRRMFEIQGRQLWRFLRGEAAGYTAFTTR